MINAHPDERTVTFAIDSTTGVSTAAMDTKASAATLETSIACSCEIDAIVATAPCYDEVESTCIIV